MIISDINYLETVSETSSVLGAHGYHGYHKKHKKVKPVTPVTPAKPTYKKSTATAVNIAVVTQTAVAISTGGNATAVNYSSIKQGASAQTK